MTVTTHFRGQLVTVEEIGHPPGEPHRDPPEELVEEDSINFVERGSFHLRLGGELILLSPEKLLLARRNLPLRFRHAEGAPTDVCTSVRFHEETLTEELEDRKETVVPLTNRLTYLRWRLHRFTEEGRDPIEVEGVAGDLVAALATTDPTPRRRLREGRLVRYARLVDRARELMSSRHSERISLRLLARDAGLSPFHFARIFRELEGTPPHRYLSGVRLRCAARLLRDGASVTEACFASGFENLSHFIRMFSRRFGSTPSRFTGRRVESAEGRSSPRG